MLRAATSRGVARLQQTSALLRRHGSSGGGGRARFTELDVSLQRGWGAAYNVAVVGFIGLTFTDWWENWDASGLAAQFGIAGDDSHGDNGHGGKGGHDGGHSDGGAPTASKEEDAELNAAIREGPAAVAAVLSAPHGHAETELSAAIRGGPAAVAAVLAGPPPKLVLPRTTSEAVAVTKNAEGQALEAQANALAGALEKAMVDSRNKRIQAAEKAARRKALKSAAAKADAEELAVEQAAASQQAAAEKAAAEQRAAEKAAAEKAYRASVPLAVGAVAEKGLFKGISDGTNLFVVEHPVYPGTPGAVRDASTGLWARGRQVTHFPEGTPPPHIQGFAADGAWLLAKQRSADGAGEHLLAVPTSGPRARFGYYDVTPLSHAAVGEVTVSPTSHDVLVEVRGLAAAGKCPYLPCWTTHRPICPPAAVNSSHPSYVSQSVA